MNNQVEKTTNETVSRYFNESMFHLVEVIKRFNDDNFNKIPFEGSWTAGQVSEHLYKSISRLPDLLSGETKDAERDPFEKCEVIASTFLNFDVKFKSPEFILPTEDRKHATFFVEGFEKTRSGVNQKIKEVNLDRLYTKFSLPQIGELTGWEWIYFSAAHSVRHTRQMKNIHDKL